MSLITDEQLWVWAWSNLPRCLTAAAQSCNTKHSAHASTSAALISTITAAAFILHPQCPSANACSRASWSLCSSISSAGHGMLCLHIFHLINQLSGADHFSRNICAWETRWQQLRIILGIQIVSIFTRDFPIVALFTLHFQKPPAICRVYVGIREARARRGHLHQNYLTRILVFAKICFAGAFRQTSRASSSRSQGQLRRPKEPRRQKTRVHPSFSPRGRQRRKGFWCGMVLRRSAGWWSSRSRR